MELYDQLRPVEIKNEVQLSSMVKERSGISEEAERAWMRGKQF